MASRVCAETGCPAVIQPGARGGRCRAHQRAQDAARGRRQDRGYGATHTRLRIDWQRRLDSGEAVHCWRCLTKGIRRPIDPSSWTLGHCDDDRSCYHGPECSACQYATSSRRVAGCPHPTHGVVSHL